MAILISEIGYLYADFQKSRSALFPALAALAVAILVAISKEGRFR